LGKKVIVNGKFLSSRLKNNLYLCEILNYDGEWIYIKTKNNETFWVIKDYVRTKCLQK
jgi:hypothetical protein